MQAIDHVMMHILEYLLISAGFGILAIFYSMYLVGKEQKTLLSKRNIPSLLVLLSIIGGTIVYSRASEEAFELQDRSRALEEQLEIENTYGRWAKLNSSGFSLDEADFRIYHMLKPAFLNTAEGQESPTNINCEENGLETLQKAIEQYPDFPFSYVYLAGCYGEKDNPEWRKYAEVAMRLLENTTQVSDHHRHHDRTYQLVQDWFRSQ